MVPVLARLAVADPLARHHPVHPQLHPVLRRTMLVVRSLRVAVLLARAAQDVLLDLLRLALRRPVLLHRVLLRK